MTKANRDDDYPRRAAVAIAACGLVVAVAIWLVVAAGVQPSAGSAPPAHDRDGSAVTVAADVVSARLGFPGVAAR
jgi:hypothetical protein